MKVIFLDIDGVLNSGGSIFENYELYKHPEFSHIPHPKHILPLYEIIQKTGAYCVLSSTWRFNWEPYQLSELLFASAKVKIPIIDKTPRVGLCGSHRGAEIHSWLEDYKNRKTAKENTTFNYFNQMNYTDIESFVILDDESDMNPFMDRLYLINHNVGLQQSDVETIIAWLT